MQETTIEKLTTARVGLLLKHPFFGNMATRMQIIDASDWCQTAATDGRNFFYNEEFVSKLSVKKLMFLFAHEICHGIFDHFGRCGSRNKKLANVAQDYAVNIILSDDNIGDVITEVDICLDAKYRGLCWEEIYDLLCEQYGQAIALFTKVTKQYRNDKRMRAEALYWKGVCAREIKDYITAYRSLKRLTWDYPESDQAANARRLLGAEEFDTQRPELPEDE